MNGGFFLHQNPSDQTNRREPLATKCPFPDCQEEAAERLSGSVFKCGACQRLALQCRRPGCGVLGRPFMAYCRSCRCEFLRQDVSELPAHLWERAGRLGHSADAIDIGGPEDVASFLPSGSARGYEAVVAASFVRGTIAIHQTGGFLALVHPFRSASDGAKHKSIIWSDDELVQTPANVRPFQPCTMPGDRHILFSDSHAVYGVHLWSLRGWSGSNERRYMPLVDCSAESSPKITAAPIPLSETEFGLLLRIDGAYRWGVFDLAPMREGTPLPDVLRRSVACPIEGQPCHAQLVADRFLAFATPKGHWVWKMGDAQSGQLDAMRRTWKRQDQSLIMNSHDENARSFHFEKQYIFHRTREPGLVTWYFQVQGLPARRFEYYDLRVDTLERGRQGVLGDADDFVSLGALENPDDARMPQYMLFMRGGRLLIDNRGTLQGYRNRNLINVVAHAAGLTFSDPLVATIVRGATGGARQLNIYSVVGGGPRHVDVGKLVSNPLLWSRWLFTVEGMEGHGVVVRRRTLCPAEAST